MEVKKHSVDDLIQMCSDAAEAIERPQASELLASSKKQLREFGGKASDLIPYLLEATSAEGGRLDGVALGKSPTLSTALSAIENALGKERATSVVGQAFREYAKDHDISYKLKRG